MSLETLSFDIIKNLPIKIIIISYHNIISHNTIYYIIIINDFLIVFRLLMF